MMAGMRLIIALLAIGLAAAHPAAAKEKYAPGETIAGPAVALDGDTLRVFPAGVDPVDVRIWGIDAPEMSAENGHGWAARAAMDGFLALGGEEVACTVVDTDKYKRPVAVCRPISTGSGPTGELGGEMIAAGWAVEYRKYTRPAPPAVEPGLADRYAKAEAHAIKTRAGRWKRVFGE